MNVPYVLLLIPYVVVVLIVLVRLVINLYHVGRFAAFHDVTVRISIVTTLAVILVLVVTGLLVAGVDWGGSFAVGFPDVQLSTSPSEVLP